MIHFEHNCRAQFSTTEAIRAGAGSNRSCWPHTHQSNHQQLQQPVHQHQHHKQHQHHAQHCHCHQFNTSRIMGARSPWFQSLTHAASSNHQHHDRLEQQHHHLCLKIMGDLCQLQIIKHLCNYERQEPRVQQIWWLVVDHTRARRTMVCTIKKRFLRWILHRGALSGIGMDGSPGAVRYRCYSKVAFQPIYCSYNNIQWWMEGVP